ncbi:LtfC-like domain-containing protein [Nocardia sp. NPDC055321]
MAIGNQPIIETLLLKRGQDLIHDIDLPAGETFPPSTTVTLIVYDLADTVLATWTASVSTSTASWDVASTVTDTIPLPAKFAIFVHYSDGADFRWYEGSVAR